MEQEKILTSHNMDSLPNVPPAHQESELRGFMDVREERRKPPRINVKSMPGKPLSIDMRDIDAVRLLSAFGTADPGFANFMLTDIIKAGCDTRQAGSPEAGINDTLAAVTGIGARDEIEGMLATQMVATHVAAIRVLRQLKFSDAITQQDSNGNLAVKLLRTFTMQLEALQRYRGDHLHEEPPGA